MHRLVLTIAFGFAVAALSVLPAHAQSAPGAPGGPPHPTGPAPAALIGDGTYRVYADLVTLGEGPPGVQGVPCVNQSVFFPGDTLVVRAVVTDGPTGKALSADNVKALGLKVVATFSNGVIIPLRYGPHPPFPNQPGYASYWAAPAHIPPNQPTGIVKWTVAVTDTKGHTTNFAPMGANAGTAELTIAQKAAPKPQ